MKATSPEPHDHHHTMPHAADVPSRGHDQHGTTGHAGRGEPGAHDRHAGHSVAMFRDKFWITLLLSIPTLLWSVAARLTLCSLRSCQAILAAWGVLLPPAFAAVLMSASTVIVAINAQLLRRATL